MATTSFVLRDADEETKVHLIVRFHNQRLVYPTEKKIHPLYWNPNSQRIRETKQFPNYRAFNDRFDEIERAGKDSVDSLVESGIKRPTVEQVREKFLSILFPKEKNEAISLLGFFTKHIETNRSVQKLNTLKVKQTTLNHLNNYAKARKKRVDFDTIDLDFYHDFTK